MAPPAYEQVEAQENGRAASVGGASRPRKISAEALLKRALDVVRLGGFVPGLVSGFFIATILLVLPAAFFTDRPPPLSSSFLGVRMKGIAIVKDTQCSSAAIAEVAQPPCPSWLAPEGDEHPSSAWYSMKVVPRPAACLLNGYAIEEIDPLNNYRRSFSLGYADDVEDRLFIPPYFLASHNIELQKAPRRIWLDLGGNMFFSSVQWINQNYPLDFTEMHVFEKETELFVIPEKASPEEGLLRQDFPLGFRTPEKGRPMPIPNWQLDRIKVYNTYVDHVDSDSTINITRFIKEELKVTPQDALIIKMDIEGAEWRVLPDWLVDLEMATLVDELFVEMHYHHPTMASFLWDQFPHPRDNATQLLVNLRNAGFFVHPWP